MEMEMTNSFRVTSEQKKVYKAFHFILWPVKNDCHYLFYLNLNLEDNFELRQVIFLPTNNGN